MAMVEQFIETPLCWLMLVIAWCAYQQLFNVLSEKHLAAAQRSEEIPLSQSLHLPTILIGSLPLMGLLGTIGGLHDSFSGMMSFGVDSDAVTSGIASALFTTQLGLLLAIPGWLLSWYVQGALKQYECQEVTP